MKNLQFYVSLFILGQNKNKKKIIEWKKLKLWKEYGFLRNSYILLHSITKFYCYTKCIQTKVKFKKRVGKNIYFIKINKEINKNVNFKSLRNTYYYKRKYYVIFENYNFSKTKKK